MLSTLISKELKAILQSPKFAATLAVCSVLMLLSVYIGIREYKATVKQYEAAQRLSEEEMRQNTAWKHLSTTALRAPDPMQIFVSGVTYDIGRWSEIFRISPIKLQGSIYADDPIYALFRYFDFAFVVQFVLSLLAILFTYDSISGERESGTLRLVFANAVPKAQYLLAKAIGAILGLIVPILLPILLSLLLVQLYQIPLTMTNWTALLGLVGISLLYFAAFIMIGLFISTLTRWSNLSFLVSLVVWVMLVLIIPRAGVMAAGQMVSVPTYSEIESKRTAFSKDQWEGLQQFIEEINRKPEQSEADATGAGNERIDYRAILDSAMNANDVKLQEYDTRLMEDFRRRKAAQERLGLTLSRFSLAAAYQLAAQSLANTDIGLKNRYEDAMVTYRNEFTNFTSKQPEEQMAGAIAISAGPEGLKINVGKGSQLDLASVPRFKAPLRTLADSLNSVLIDGGLLLLSILIMFAGSFIAFLRYDVR